MEEHEVLWPSGRIPAVHIWFLLLLGQVSPGFLTSFPLEAPQSDGEHSACRRELGAPSVSSHKKSSSHRLILTFLEARLPGA